MPITLYTGLPGAGKTAALVAMMKGLIEKSEARPVYACNIDGLQLPGVLPLNDVNTWQDLPDGAIIFVDEVQKFWPGRRQGQVLPPIAALSEHRHRGFDFYIATQTPTMIDKWVRDLVQTHVHHERPHGTNVVKTLRWEHCQSDLSSTSGRDLAIRGVSTLPKAVFDLYKSASVHTVKKRIPRIAYFVGLAPLIIALLVWLIGDRMSVLGGEEAQAASAPPAPVTDVKRPAGSFGLPGSDSARKPPMTAEEWLLAQTPRVPGIPWSAPIFDGFKAQEVPEVLCVMNNTRNKCLCQSDQGTRVQVDDRICRRIAIHGVYNPYRKKAGLG